MATYNRAALRDAVRLAAKVLPSKPSTHLLRCVRLDAANVTAVGDVEAAVVRATPTKGTVEVQVVANELLERIEKARGDELSLDVVEANLVIKAKGSKWTIPTVPLVDALAVPKVSAPSFETIDATVLRRALEGALPAAGVDAGEAQYFGVELLPEGKLVTTDGRRVHVFQGGPAVPVAIVITPQFAKLLIGLKDETYRVAVTGKDVMVEVDGATFYHRQLGTAFAPADKLVDLTWKHLEGSKVATVVADDFVTAVEAASLAAEHSQVTLQIDGGTLTVVGRSSGDTSHCEAAGDLETVASSAPLLVQAVRAIGAPTVELHTSNNIQVGIVVCAAGAKPNTECAMIAQTIR